MGTRTSNGNTQILAAVLGAARELRVDVVAPQASVADLEELHCALAAMQLRFGAVLRQLDRLHRGDAQRAQERALLAEAMENARRIAYHDELTGLPNRHLLLDHFNQVVALAERHDKHVALLFLDLDGFKHVNDILGHSVGDKLLQHVAARLVACLRVSDTVCRYGGDEFVVLLPELAGKESAAALADSIRAHLAAPYIIDGYAITMTTSLGVAMHAVDAHAYDDLLRIADLAMYRDKARHPAGPSITSASVAALLGLDEAGNP